MHICLHCAVHLLSKLWYLSFLAHHDLIGFKWKVVAYGLNVPWIIINEN